MFPGATATNDKTDGHRAEAASNYE